MLKNTEIFLLFHFEQNRDLLHSKYELNKLFFVLENDTEHTKHSEDSIKFEINTIAFFVLFDWSTPIFM